MRTIHLVITASVLMAGCAQSGPDTVPRWGSTSWCDSPHAALDKSARCTAPRPGESYAMAAPVESAPMPAAYEPAPVAPPAAEPVDDHRNEAERFVLAQPAASYAVQVFADPSEERLRRFARTHSLPERLHVRTERDGRTWHVLLLDVYPTIEGARAGLAQVAGLPNQPWIRQLGGLQAIIR